MTLYADSIYPVGEDLAAEHERQLAAWGKAGKWGSGAQRVAVAIEARRAAIDAGLLEAPGDGVGEAEVELPGVVRRVVRQVAVAPKDIEQDFYHQALADGLSDGEYVEIVGVVARITAIDVFARGIGVSLRPLPAAQHGTPSRERPATAVTELAWVPTVPNAPDGGAVAEDLYGGNPKPYIMRALSLVPSETRLHMAQERVQYMPLEKVMQFDFQHHDGLTRPQVEVVAGRVSALNECFY